MIKNIILKPKGPFSLNKLAGFTKDKILGKSNIIINKISSIENAISGSITFIDNKKYEFANCNRQSLPPRFP